MGFLFSHFDLLYLVVAFVLFNISSIFLPNDALYGRIGLKLVKEVIWLIIGSLLILLAQFAAWHDDIAATICIGLIGLFLLVITISDTWENGKSAYQRFLRKGRRKKFEGFYTNLSGAEVDELYNRLANQHSDWTSPDDPPEFKKARIREWVIEGGYPK